MSNRLQRRVPNRSKHEYEVQRGSSHLGVMLYVGTSEHHAVKQAMDLMAGKWNEEDHVRLYHSYPSPGPVRRYVGRITKADATLHRPI